MLSVAAGGLTLAALGVIYKSWRAQASTYLYLGLLVCRLLLEKNLKRTESIYFLFSF